MHLDGHYHVQVGRRLGAPAQVTRRPRPVLGFGLWGRHPARPDPHAASPQHSGPLQKPMRRLARLQGLRLVQQREVAGVGGDVGEFQPLKEFQDEFKARDIRVRW